MLDEVQTGIKISGRNINNLSYADDSTLVAEREEKLRSLLMRVKEEREKVGLAKLIQCLRFKNKIKLKKKNSTLRKPRLWHSVPALLGKYKGEKWKQSQILFSWAPKSP